MGQPAQKQIHPIATEAAMLLVEKGDQMVLPDTAVKALTDSLARLKGQPTLQSAMEALVDLAAHLQHDLGSEETATKLLTIATTAIDDLANQKLESAEKETDRAKERFEQLTASAQAKAAPKLDAKAPKDSLKLSSLLPRGKLSG